MENKILIFLDTEFTDLAIDSRLISMGLVSEDGREFYAELSDTYQVKDCSAFTQEAVLPLLKGGNALMTMHELSERLTAWIEAFGQPVKIATDSLSWDWPWIFEVMGDRQTWPENLDGKPFVLSMNYLNDYDQFVDAMEKGFAGGLKRHCALDDAKANRLGWLASGSANDGQ